MEQRVFPGAMFIGAAHGMVRGAVRYGVVLRDDDCGCLVAAWCCVVRTSGGFMRCHAKPCAMGLCAERCYVVLHAEHRDGVCNVVCGAVWCGFACMNACTAPVEQREFPGVVWQRVARGA